MRGLALALVAAAVLVSGCGGSDNSSSSAPKQTSVAQSGTTVAQAAGVSAKKLTVSGLCAPEGKGKPKKQCTAGLAKLNKGKAKNPRTACKALSKKKTKGVRGKSPFAVCVKAAAALMAAKQNVSQGSGSAAGDSSGSGSSDSSGSSDGSSDATDSSADGTDGSDSSGDLSSLVCTDANGNVVPFDSPDVEECDDTSASASDSSSGSADSSSLDDSSDDGN